MMYGIASLPRVFFATNRPTVTAGLTAPPETPIVVEIPIARPNPFARAAIKSDVPESEMPRY